MFGTAHPHDRRSSGARTTASLLLVAIGSLPFLIPLHLPPIPTFYGEWVAGVLALLLAIVCFWQARHSGKIPLPSIMVLPAILLAAIALQFALGLIHFPQQGLIYAAYLLLAAIAISCGYLLRQGLGTQAMCTALASGIALGALLQVIPAVLQQQGLALAGLTTPRVPGYAIYGNLAQANQLADYLWLGVASLLYLWSRRRIHATGASIAIIPILLVAPYTGSRSILLYPIALIAITWSGWSLFRRQPESRHLPQGLLLICLFALAAMFMPRLLPVDTLAVPAVVAERLIHGVVGESSPSVRLALWQTALDATLASPWLGGGVGAVPWQSLVHAGAASTTEAEGFGIAEHFHNLPLNWLAEFGIPFSLAALLVLGLWAFRLLRQEWTAETWWVLAMLAIIGVHSMLEYPLWHAYFLLPTALLLGAFSSAGTQIRLSFTIRTALLAGALLAAFLLHNLRDDHFRLWRAVHLVPSGPQAEQVWRANIQDLLRLQRESMFSPYVSGMLVVAMELDGEQLKAKQQLCVDALKFSPAEGVLFKCAAIEVLAGNEAAGQQLMQWGMRAFPAAGKAYRSQLESLSASYPQLRTLLN